MKDWRTYTKSMQEMCSRKGISYEAFMNGLIDEDGNEIE